MNQKLGMAEFFAMEAGEYLERLDAMVSAATPPDPNEFQRLARALRGAALMANQQPIAAATGAFEHVARAVKEGSRPWDEATKQLAIRAVDDLKVFVRRVRDWNDDDTAKAHDLANALQSVSGRPSQPLRTPQAGPDSGTRAFIGREGAALASALDRAAKTLAQNPGAREPLDGILSVMQPLRGLATLADLPPMPELLEGIETAVREATRGDGPRSGTAEVFAAAAEALSEATRRVSAAGSADPESAEIRLFADRLGAFLEMDQPVDSIESLYFDDAGPHVVEQGAPPAAGPAMTDVEFVSHGEHLRQVADDLDGAAGPTIRAFRTHGLAGTFRALEGAGGSPLGNAAARFARNARNAVGSGHATADPTAYAATLREAGAVLSTAAQGASDALATRLDEIAAGLVAAPAEVAAPAAAPSPVPDTPPAVEAPAPVATASPPAAPTAAPASAPRAATAPGGALAATLMEAHQLREQLGEGPASLDDLLAGPPAAPAPGAAAAPARPATAPAAPAAPAAATGDTLISINELVYSPADAMARAASLRDHVRSAVAQGAPDAPELIEEIFDLVQLGLGTAR